MHDYKEFRTVSADEGAAVPISLNGMGDDNWGGTQSFLSFTQPSSSVPNRLFSPLRTLNAPADSTHPRDGS